MPAKRKAQAELVLNLQFIKNGTPDTGCREGSGLATESCGVDGDEDGGRGGEGLAGGVG